MARIDEIVMLENSLKEAQAVLQKHEVRRNQCEAEKKNLQNQVDERTQDVELSVEHLHTILRREVVDLVAYEKARNLVNQAQDNLQALTNKITMLSTELEHLDGTSISKAKADIKALSDRLGEYGQLVPFKA